MGFKFCKFCNLECLAKIKASTNFGSIYVSYTYVFLDVDIANIQKSMFLLSAKLYDLQIFLFAINPRYTICIYPVVLSPTFYTLTHAL